MAIDWMTAIAASGLAAAVFGRHLLKELSDFVSRYLDRRSVMRAWEHDHDRDDMLAAAQAMHIISGRGEPPLPQDRVAMTELKPGQRKRAS